MSGHTNDRSTQEPITQDPITQIQMATADAAAEATLADRLDIITRMARRLFRVPVVLISLLDGGALRLAACQGLAMSALGREPGLDRATLLGNGPLIVNDTQADPRFSAHAFVTGAPHVRFYAGCLVIGHDGAVAGVLSVCDRAPNALTEGDLPLLRDLARLVESELRIAAMGRSQLELAAERENMRRKALIDTNTHLWNRHAMFELLDREFHRARREREHVSVIFGEVDDFAALAAHNDEAATRAVLAEAALRIRAVVRRSDTVARFGADQFLVFLGRCQIEAAVALAERMRQRMRKSPVSVGSIVLPITMSFGVASSGPEGDWTPDSLVSNAELALRAAQEAGRDRVIAHGAKEVRHPSAG